MDKAKEQKKSQIKTQTKKNILVRKIALSFLILFASLFAFLVYARYVFTDMSKTKSKLSNVQGRISSVLSEEQDMERKAYLTKIYIETWKNEMTGEQKSLGGIDIEKIKDLFATLSENNYIMNLKTSMSLPAPVNFKKTSVNIMNSEIVLTFNCLTEYSVYNFLQQLWESKIGFFIVEEVRIKKNRSLDKNILGNLIKGVLDNMFEASIKLQWYNAMGKKI